MELALRHRPTFQALALAFFGGLAGLTANALRGEGLDLRRPVLAAAGEIGGASCAAPEAAIPEIDLAEARRLHGEGADFVDARPAGTYGHGHVAGALHLPSRGEAPDATSLVASLGARPVVVYDGGGDCELARHLAGTLSARGIPDVRVMLGGYAAWQDAGEAVQSGVCEACAQLAEGR